MANSFGKAFRMMSFGESHGKAVGVVVDGVKAGLAINPSIIQKELDRRKPGQSKVTTSRKEADKIEILSGVFRGKTTGHPICMVVYNKDMRPKDYSKIRNLFRPGHADYTFYKKYGIRDFRGGGRQSGRETISRVAAGGIAKKILGKTRVISYTKQIGPIKISKIDYSQIEKNPVRSPDTVAAKKMEKAILKVKSEGDSLGGIVECVVKNMPIGIGEPVFDKLEASISKAVMSIGAIKGIEFGAGFSSALMKGSEHNDSFIVKKGKVKLKTNNSGGILGGISSGADIIFRVVVKPTSTISKEQTTVDSSGKKKKISVKGRHDPCLVPRIVPVVENMTAIVIADLLMQQKARRK